MALFCELISKWWFSLNHEAGIVSAITNGFRNLQDVKSLTSFNFLKLPITFLETDAANKSKLPCGNSKTFCSSMNRYPVFGVWMQGLGRMFLRHLRRTRLLVHVVDASNPDPVQDYTVLREVSLVSVCIIE